MRFGTVAVFAGLLAGTASLCAGPNGVAVAQEAAPPAPGAPVNVVVPPAIGRERIVAEILDLEPAGDPVVTEVTGKNEVIVSLPLRLKDEGRLAADIATASYRMAAGAPVVHREFKQRGTDQSEAVQAWCGPGESRTMFGWSGGTTVCMVHTADGKANLGSSPLGYFAWWMATSVAFISPDARTERVAVEPVQTPSEFRLIFVYERLRPNGVVLHAAIEGPGQSAEAKPYRYNMARQTLALTDGVATLAFDGLKVSLTPQRRGDVVAAASERVAPPVNLDALRAEALAERAALAPPAEDAPDGGEPDEAKVSEADGLEPTPFVIGGVKVDPAALTVGQGVLVARGVALSGEAQYAQTARLTQPMTLRAPFINDTSETGTILHQVEFARITPLGSRTMTRLWCGPIMKPAVFSNGQRQTLCLRRSLYGAGWEAFIPMTGRPWLGTTLTNATAGGFAANGLAFETSPTSLLGPLGVRAEIQRINDKSVTLRLFARQGDQDALILTVTPEFVDGVATVPLWTHRLVLTRSGEGVTAALTADGDGTAPSDKGVYP
jgi:hypothetical protein